MGLRSQGVRVQQVAHRLGRQASPPAGARERVLHLRLPLIARVDQAREMGPSSTVEAALERWFTAPFRVANPEMMEVVRGWVTANQKSIYHTIYRVLATGIDEILAPDPAISCPALIITGDEDYGNGPEMTQAIAAEISGAQAVVLKGQRHMALAESPDAVNRPIRTFLDTLSLAP